MRYIMNDVFALHNITHLSASTINLWISNPAMCLMKLAGHSSIAGPAAWRGTGVDKAVSALIAKDISRITSAYHVAESEFDERVSKYGDLFEDKKIEKEKQHMIRCIDAANISFVESCQKRQFKNTQGKVEVTFDDLPVPFIGYYDLLFEDTVFDLKSKSYALSKPTLADCRQLSIYQKATGKQPWVAYITHKEVRQFMIEDCDKHLREIENAAKSLERVLSVSDDIKECCRMVYPDFDHWMWSVEDKKIASEIWRMK